MMRWRIRNLLTWQLYSTTLRVVGVQAVVPLAKY